MGLCLTDEEIRTVSGYSGGNYKYEMLEENPVIYIGENSICSPADLARLSTDKEMISL